MQVLLAVLQIMGATETTSGLAVVILCAELLATYIHVRQYNKIQGIKRFWNMIQMNLVLIIYNKTEVMSVIWYVATEHKLLFMRTYLGIYT